MLKGKPKADPGEAGQEGQQPQFKENPQVNAKIDEYIKNNPKYWDYVQSMTPERRWQRFKRWRRLLKRSNSMSPILDDIVSRFAKHQVEFVIVGGVSAVLQGAAVNNLRPGYLLSANA